LNPGRQACSSTLPYELSGPWILKHFNMLWQICLCIVIWFNFISFLCRTALNTWSLRTHKYCIYKQGQKGEMESGPVSNVGSQLPPPMWRRII
jgi:hypothetical protein